MTKNDQPDEFGYTAEDYAQARRNLERQQKGEGHAQPHHKAGRPDHGAGEPSRGTQQQPLTIGQIKARIAATDNPLTKAYLELMLTPDGKPPAVSAEAAASKGAGTDSGFPKGVGISLNGGYSPEDRDDNGTLSWRELGDTLLPGDKVRGDYVVLPNDAKKAAGRLESVLKEDFGGGVTIVGGDDGKNITVSPHEATAIAMASIIKDRGLDFYPQAIDAVSPLLNELRPNLSAQLKKERNALPEH